MIGKPLLGLMIFAMALASWLAWGEVAVSLGQPNQPTADLERRAVQPIQKTLQRIHGQPQVSVKAAPEILKGQILSVDIIRLRSGLSDGVQISLETDDELIPVYLGPKWYVEQQRFLLAPHMNVEVEGLRVHHRDYDMVVAGHLTSEDETLEIMDRETLGLWRTMSAAMLSEALEVLPPDVR